MHLFAAPKKASPFFPTAPGLHAERSGGKSGGKRNLFSGGPSNKYTWNMGVVKIKDLLQRSKRGDRDAFVQLIDQHRQMLYNTALLMLKNEDDALDAIQDTILACWENLPLLKKNSYFKTWMTKILWNKCYDILRTKSRYSHSESLPEEGTESDWDTPMDVDKTFRRLPNGDQVILSLFYYDDLSVRQIAESLSISEGAVRVRLTRSRDRFKKLYQQEEGAAYEK